VDVAHWQRACLPCFGLIPILAKKKKKVKQTKQKTVHTVLTIWEAEAGGIQVQGQIRLYNKMSFQQTKKKALKK
jgi:hypothetical protein